MKLNTVFNLIFLSALCASCGNKFGSDSGPGETKLEYYMVDGVKNIRSNTEDNLQPDTFREDHYTLTDQSRLLLRFENLASHTGKIVLGDKDQIWIRVVVSERSSMDEAVQLLRLCPMMKNWMMMATWKYAHPFSKSGVWAREGADYDFSSCVSPVADPGKKLPSETSALDARALYFNISRWYLDVFKGRDSNLGHVLLLQGAGWVEILGDNSISFAPRIQWSEAAITD